MSKLLNFQQYYLLGIKGQGMTALAQLLVAHGKRVMGADTSDTFSTDEVLKRCDIVVSDFAVAAIDETVECVVYSTSYAQDHPVLEKARQRGLPIFTYAQAMGELFSEKKGIAVVGTHGKTTTTALLGIALIEAGLDPTVAVGFTIPQFSGNVRWGESDIFVAEVDEYQNKMRYFAPHGVVVTGVDYDHVDFFPTRKDYQDAFVAFFKKIPHDGFLVYNADDPFLRKAASTCACRTIGYGLHHGAFRLCDVAKEQNRAVIKSDQREELALALSLHGEMVLLDAIAAFVAGKELGGDDVLLLRGEAAYTGAKRRMEFVGEILGATVLDDYAHHPEEIRVTLAALRASYPGRRLVCVFHPHTYSRTKALFTDFIDALTHADAVALLEVYASAREREEAYTAQPIVTALRKKGVAAEWTPTIEDAIAYLKKNTRPHDVIITMGAGDVWKVGVALVQ